MKCFHKTTAKRTELKMGSTLKTPIAQSLFES